MNPYTILSSGAGTNEAADLSARLSAWHDTMVAHERRLRAGTTSDACDDDCAHAEARSLWAEAVATFGPRAEELAFLRSRAQARRRSASPAEPAHVRSEPSMHASRRGPEARAHATLSPLASSAAAEER